jgi:hypothetical protein
MIIFGVKTTESTASAGMFHCPRCQTSQAYRCIAHNRWFTLYFIPILPLGRLGEQVECQGCYSRFSPEVLTTGQSGEALTAIVIDEQDGSQKTAAPLTWEQPKTSALAITSIIFALISPVFLCACGLSLVTSLAAIVAGHAARWNIKRSKGRLAGGGLAVAGLVLGYPLLILSIGVLALFAPSVREGWQNAERRGAGQRPPARQTAEDRLQSAEMQVLAHGAQGAASGNSPEATRLAEEYAQALKIMRDAMFTEDRDRILSMTKGKFLVHCELHPGRCTFIVHVPAYRDFAADAKELLEVSAWQLAQQTVDGTLNPNDALAVGLRGSLLYGAVLVGTAGADQSDPDNFRRAERDALLAFFPGNGGADASSPLQATEPLAEREDSSALDGRPPVESPEAPPAAEDPGGSPGSAHPPAIGEDEAESGASPATPTS